MSEKLELEVSSKPVGECLCLAAWMHVHTQLCMQTDGKPEKIMPPAPILLGRGKNRTDKQTPD